MTDDIALSWLFYALVALLALSAFFAMSETCLMALNRYRLKHLIREGSHGAKLAGKLLTRTDELLSFILAGNTLINAAITILVAEICRRLLGTGDYVLAVATRSRRASSSSCSPRSFQGDRRDVLRDRSRSALPYVLAPLIRRRAGRCGSSTSSVKAIPRVMRVQPTTERGACAQHGGAAHARARRRQVPPEEAPVDLPQPLRARGHDGRRHDDAAEPDRVASTCPTTSRRCATRSPPRITRASVVCESGLDNVAGILHVRKVLNATRREQIDAEGLREIMREPYFVPEGTALLTQLTNFQENQRHMGLVVDEYGEILGLVTMKDILEEIVGEFTSQAIGSAALFHREPDGTRDRRRRLLAARAEPQGRLRFPARGTEDHQRAAARGARGHSRGGHDAQRSADTRWRSCRCRTAW